MSNLSNKGSKSSKLKKKRSKKPKSKTKSKSKSQNIQSSILLDDNPMVISNLNTNTNTNKFTNSKKITQINLQIANLFVSTFANKQQNTKNKITNNRQSMYKEILNNFKTNKVGLFVFFYLFVCYKSVTDTCRRDN